MVGSTLDQRADYREVYSSVVSAEILVRIPRIKHNPIFSIQLLQRDDQICPQVPREISQA